jgi:hypothetical protein
MKGKLLLVLTLSIFVFSNTHSQEACLNKAWKAFGAEDYETAIKNCNECIENFGDAANEMQGKLEAAGKTNESFPAGGVNAEMKEKIFENWALNDVSTAYYIKGVSAKRLFESNSDKSYKQMSEEALKETCSLSFGRCWDPNGWFWSPCDAASDELSKW